MAETPPYNPENPPSVEQDAALASHVEGPAAPEVAVETARPFAAEFEQFKTESTAEIMDIARLSGAEYSPEQMDQLDELFNRLYVEAYTLTLTPLLAGSNRLGDFVDNPADPQFQRLIEVYGQAELNAQFLAHCQRFLTRLRPQLHRLVPSGADGQAGP